ncbi:MAG TPA: TonB-dependent receptor plug domain-containing protein [Longimicrobium sp.]
MPRCLRLLLCLPLLATTACAADAIAGPRLTPEPEAVAQAAPEPQAAEVAAPASVVICRGCARESYPRAAEPLYVIDGVPASAAQALAALDANEIASIEVIKAEVAASLYSNRSMSGLVILTTRAAAGRPR